LPGLFFLHLLTVVTRNERDFARCDVPTINPWVA
jgi:predicted nucleic acid-binding protein